MRRIGLILAMVAVSAGAAAAKGASAKPPAELIASLARGPASALDGMRDFANAIQPGAGMMMTDAVVDKGFAQVAGMGSLDGLDHASPMYLLFVDGGGQKGFAVVGKVGDATKLPTAGAIGVATGNGWVVLGPAAVVKKVSTYALATFPTAPAVTTPTVTVYVAQALARYHTEIQKAQVAMAANMAASGAQMGGFAQSYVDGILGAAKDCDRLLLTVDASKDGAGIDLALVPLPGTKLAKFVATQHPSDYALLDDLPAATPMMLFAGHLEAGPYRAGLLDLGSRIYGASAPKELIQFMDAIMKASTADVAMTMDMSNGMSANYVFGVADRKAVDGSITKLLALLGKGRTFDVMGMKTTMAADPGSTDHDGVALRGYSATYDLSKLPAANKAQMAKMMNGGTVKAVVASFDQLGLFTMGPNSDTDAGRTIDAARGKGKRYTPSTEVADFLTASRARKESIVMVMDFGSFASMMATPAKMKGAMVMSLGFADGSAHMRMSMSTATIKSMKP